MDLQPSADPYNVVCRAARFVMSDYKCTSSVTDMLRDLKWETLQDRREKARLISLYKEVHHITPCNISHHLAKNIVGKSCTRNYHELKFNIIHPNKDCYHFSLYPRTFRIWNSLPASTKTAPDVDNFKFIINGN